MTRGEEVKAAVEAVAHRRVLEPPGSRPAWGVPAWGDASEEVDEAVQRVFELAQAALVGWLGEELAEEPEVEEQVPMALCSNLGVTLMLLGLEVGRELAREGS